MAYNSQQRAEALALLEANEGNILRTSQQLGIGEATLHDWVSQSRDPKTPIAEETKAILPEVKEDFLARLVTARDKVLDQLDTQIADLKAREAAVTLGILIDKVELLKGNATQRVESVGNGETVNEAIERIKQEFESRFSRSQVLEVASTRMGDSESEPTTT